VVGMWLPNKIVSHVHKIAHQILLIYRCRTIVVPLSYGCRTSVDGTEETSPSEDSCADSTKAEDETPEDSDAQLTLDEYYQKAGIVPGPWMEGHYRGWVGLLLFPISLYFFLFSKLRKRKSRYCFKSYVCLCLQMQEPFALMCPSYTNMTCE
jgi:hypothetical protein